MRKLTLVCSATAALLAVSAAHAAVLYRSTDGWSVEGNAADANEAAAVDLMTRAEKADAAGDPDAATDLLRTLGKKHPASALAPKAQIKLGNVLEKRGSFDDAYTAYESYLAKFPNGADFDYTTESMFRIARLFLDGQKKKVLGLSIASGVSRAKKMFEGIVVKAPYSRIAPMAQFNIGQALEKQNQLPEAISAYNQTIIRYASDAIADDAQYQIGYVLLRQYREGSKDAAAAQRAREAFEEFINRYPDSEKVAQAKENLKQLEGGATKGSLDIAKFYDKTKNYKAAVIYYKDVIKAQPDSPEATFAKNRIEELRSLVGEDALFSGPEKTETGARAAARRKLQAKVDTVSRPDYVGPPVVMPIVPDEVAPSNRPRLRTSPSDLTPLPPVEPALPSIDPLLPTPKPAPPAEEKTDKPAGEKPVEPAPPKPIE